MTVLHKLVIALLALVLTSAVSYWAGSESVQREWDKDKAVRAALLESEQKKADAAVESLKDKHQKEMEHAKSEAGRAAINRWLRDHGLLPSGLPVSGYRSEAADGCAKVPDGTTGEQRTSGSLEGFAINCAADAMRLSDWQELCKDQGCEVR